MTNALIESGEASLNVVLLDAMKLTRSAFHHSVNYRSVTVFGKASELKSDVEKLKGLKSIINHFVPNRWEFCRAPNKNELKETRVIEIKIEIAAEKTANGPIEYKESDLNLDFWAREILDKTSYFRPIPDNKLNKEIEIPKHIMEFYKNKNE